MYETWVQIATVSYALALAAVVVIVHTRFHRRGAMHWNAVQWSHVTCGVRGARAIHMAVLRFGMAACVFSTLGYLVSRPWTPNLANGGPVILATFTVWCWILIGVYGLLAGTLSALDAAGKGDGSSRCAKILVRVAWVLFEVMFSCAMLVFLVVWLVLLPQGIVQTGKVPGEIFSWAALIMHNLNLGLMGAEMLLNRLSFVSSHVLFAMYLSLIYAVFSWFWSLNVGKFYYSFIDWRRPVVFIGYTCVIALQWAVFFCGNRMTAWAKVDLAERLPDITSAPQNVG